MKRLLALLIVIVMLSPLVMAIRPNERIVCSPDWDGPNECFKEAVFRGGLVVLRSPTVFRFTFMPRSRFKRGDMVFEVFNGVRDIYVPYELVSVTNKDVFVGLSKAVSHDFVYKQKTFCKEVLLRNDSTRIECRNSTVREWVNWSRIGSGERFLLKRGWNAIRISGFVPMYYGGEFYLLVNTSLGSLVLDPVISSCGSISSPGEYFLDRDIYSNTDSICISLGNTQNVTLDCNGYMIYSNTSGSGGWNNYGIYLYNSNNVSIRDCVVKRFNWGAYIKYGGNISFRNCSFYNSSRGLDWSEAGILAQNNLDDDLRVYDSVFMFNKHGVFADSYVYVNNSYFLNNTGIGVRLRANAGGSLIENSLFKENSGNGIRGEVWYVCNNNTFVKNNYYGEIYLSYHADDNSVIKNSFFNCTGTCVQLHDVVNVSFVNNTFVEVGTHSLWIYNLNDSSFINNSFVGGGTYAAVVFANSGVGSSNNTFISCRFHDSNIGFQTDVKPANDTWIIDSVFSGNNIDLKLDTNSSYNTSMVYLVNTSTSADIDILGNDLLFRGWYMRAYVNNTDGEPVQGAIITAWDKDGVLRYNETSMPNGYTEWRTLWQYWENSTYKYNYTPYTVNASKTPFSTITRNVLLDSSKTIVFTFPALKELIVRIINPIHRIYYSPIIFLNVSYENYNESNLTITATLNGIVINYSNHDWLSLPAWGSYNLTINATHPWGVHGSDSVVFEAMSLGDAASILGIVLLFIAMGSMIIYLSRKKTPIIYVVSLIFAFLTSLISLQIVLLKINGLDNFVMSYLSTNILQLLLVGLLLIVSVYLSVVYAIYMFWGRRK